MKERKIVVKGKVNPELAKDVYVAPGAIVIGDVTIGGGSSVWYQATVRGDDAAIVIGKKTNIQDNAVLHVDQEMPLVLGDGCTVGHGAILHSCEVGDNTLIGMGAIVLNGAKIGKNCLIGAGALVTQYKDIPDGSLVLGSPAQVVRSLHASEIQDNQDNASVYVEAARAHTEGQYGVVRGEAYYIG